MCVLLALQRPGRCDATRCLLPSWLHSIGCEGYLYKTS